MQSIKDIALSREELALAEDTNVPETNPQQGDLFPKDRDLIVRNEFNLERYSSFLFPHARSNNLDKRRELPIRDQSGKEWLLSITPPAGDKALTHSTYRDLLVSILWWFRNPTPDGSVSITTADICKIKGISARSGKNNKAIRESFRKLGRTLISWEGNFISDGDPGDTEDMAIIQDLSTKSTKGNGAETRIKFKFREHILQNLLANKTNPKNLSSVLKIPTEIGQVLFRYLDTKVSMLDPKKTIYRKKSKSLFEALSFDVEEGTYKKLSERKRVLERIIPYLQGLTLSTGETLSVWIEETKDGKEINLCAKKIPPEFAITRKPRNPRKVINSKDKIDYLVNEIFEVVGDDMTDWLAIAIASHYSENIIFRALGNFKESLQGGFSPRSHGALFSNYMHSICHETGTEWLSECDPETCKHNRTRGNQLELEG